MEGGLKTSACPLKFWDTFFEQCYRYRDSVACSLKFQCLGEIFLGDVIVYIRLPN